MGSATGNTRVLYTARGLNHWKRRVLGLNPKTLYLTVATRSPEAEYY